MLCCGKSPTPSSYDQMLMMNSSGAAMWLTVHLLLSVVLLLSLASTTTMMVAVQAQPFEPDPPLDPTKTWCYPSKPNPVPLPSQKNPLTQIIVEWMYRVGQSEEGIFP